jgi:hypothetical protein
LKLDPNNQVLKINNNLWEIDTHFICNKINYFKEVNILFLVDQFYKDFNEYADISIEEIILYICCGKFQEISEFVLDKKDQNQRFNNLIELLKMVINTNTKKKLIND